MFALRKRYLELKKQFDDLIFEIVRTRTVNKSTDADYLIEKISPQIDKINNILNKTYNLELMFKSNSLINKDILIKKLLIDICENANS